MNGAAEQPSTIRFDQEKHFLGKLCRHGHEHEGTGMSVRYRLFRHRACVACSRQREAARKVENSRRTKARAKQMRQAFKQAGGIGGWERSRNPFSTYCSTARSRARKLNLPCDIRVADLREQWDRQGGQCFWTGLPLDFMVGIARHPLRPSLDRIDPARGYVRGNFVWSTVFANFARNNLPAAEFFGVLRVVGKHLPAHVATEEFSTQQALLEGVA
jgi:hypothetical protein